MQLICESRSQTQSQLVEHYHNNPDFYGLFTKREFNNNLTKALALTMQATLKKSILLLVKEFVDITNTCLSVEDSQILMEKWCAHQKINPGEFINNCIQCLVNA